MYVQMYVQSCTQSTELHMYVQMYVCAELYTKYRVTYVSTDVCAEVYICKNIQTQNTVREYVCTYVWMCNMVQLCVHGGETHHCETKDSCFDH